MRPFRSRALTALATVVLFLGLLGTVALADEIPTTSVTEAPGDHAAAPTMSFPEDPWPGLSLPMGSFPEDPWPDLT
jgi:hypothetical protein